VQLAVTSRYFNNSEGCICAKRFLVAESLFDDFHQSVCRTVEGASNGRSHEGSIKVGPLALARARKNLHRQVLDAVKAGARILTGGEIPAGPGNFYPPTVLVGLPPQRRSPRKNSLVPWL